jgi:actin-related protein
MCASADVAALRAGGTAACPGLEARVRAELRPLVPAGTALRVRSAPAPALAAGRGGAALAASDAYASVRRSRIIASRMLIHAESC